MKPLVYIITINWNGLEDTIECLHSLERITYPNYRIIVVDNGSQNVESNILMEKFPKIELVKNEKNEGFVIANNQGIEMAINNGADYVLLLNNDTVVKDNFLNILIAYAEANGDASLLSPKILYYSSNKIWSNGGKISYFTGLSIMIGKGKDSGKYLEVVEPDFVSGCAMLVKKAVIDNIGLLDPIYFAYYEDADYCFRAKKSGYRNKVIPESIVWHKKSASAGIRGSNKVTPTQAFLWARNGLIFARKNLNGWRLLTFLIGQFTAKFIVVILRASRPRSIYGYLCGLYRGLNGNDVRI